MKGWSRVLGHEERRRRGRSARSRKRRRMQERPKRRQHGVGRTDLANVASKGRVSTAHCLLRRSLLVVFPARSYVTFNNTRTLAGWRCVSCAHPPSPFLFPPCHPPCSLYHLGVSFASLTFTLGFIGDNVSPSSFSSNLASSYTEE